MQNTLWLDTAKVSNQRVCHCLREQASLLYETRGAYGHVPPLHHHCQMLTVSPTPTSEGA